MTRPTLLLLVCAPLACGGLSGIATQAQEGGEIVVHVDQGHPIANDRNDGTAAAPLKTIGEGVRRALEARRGRLSTRILVHPGTYRESLVLTGEDEATGASIVLQGAGEGAAIISGSDVWRQWQRGGERNLYRHEWPFDWRPPELPAGWDQVRSLIERQPILLHGEMVFVNGMPLEQVFSDAEMRQRAGTFYIETLRRPGARSVIWAHSAEDLTRDASIVEVSVRPALLEATGIHGLTLQRLIFQHASSQLQDAAVRITRSTGVRVDASRFVQNSWIGLGVYESSDVVVNGVDASANGAGGIQAWRVRGLAVTDTEASRNNWRGARGNFTGWATGQKFVSVHGGRFERYRAVGNQATGLWLDTDNKDVTISDAVVCGNLTRGVFLEASPGPIRIENSRICDNGEIGVMATGAGRVTLDGNTITGNRQHQIFLPWIVDDHVQAVAPDFETGQPTSVRSAEWTLVRNAIGGDGDSLLLSVGRWPWFFDTLRSDQNRWNHATRRAVFGVYPRRGASPERLDFEGWRQASGQERLSAFTYP
jgi:hypothetical protein